MDPQKRSRQLNNFEYKTGLIVYWMTREHRVLDNWSLHLAIKQANLFNVPLIVVFCLRTNFKHKNERIVSFLLGGLKEVEKNLNKLNIEFKFLLVLDPVEAILEYLKERDAGCLITDFYPIKPFTKWKENLVSKLNIPILEVDSHNIVPCWIASNKQEYGAFTLRPKIYRLLAEYLVDFPEIEVIKVKSKNQSQIDWMEIEEKLKVDQSVTKSILIPGQKAALEKLEEFIEQRFSTFNQNRNDPTKDSQSHLSPYLHFGHISSQTIALRLGIEKASVNKDSFLEELIIRKELSDNFCFYNQNYDNSKSFPNWAQKTIQIHKDDPREYLYSKQELEQAKTHDELWNASQLELVQTGRMHGYMRMYWAKKILEWSVSVDQAMKVAIYLNDKYELDGRDPNGYTGIAWSMGGVHDRTWFDRPIFGTIRYMSYNGAKAKFKIAEYIKKQQSLV